MKTFPMFLQLSGRRVVIVGGGEQAVQKSRLMLKTEAEIVLTAPTLCDDLLEVVADGRAVWVDAGHPRLFDNTALVFVATGCKGADAAWQARAKAAGMLVNVVDYPELCDVLTPSIVDRDPVVVAIGTEGTAPVLGRRIKTEIEQMLHPRLGAFAAMAGRRRADVAFHLPMRSHRDFWRWVFNAAPWRAFSSGHEQAASRMIDEKISTGHNPELGHLCIAVGATHSGLIPMAVVQRMQEADVIYWDKGIPADVLEFARRDAERVRLAPQPGNKSPFQGAAALILDAARTGGVVCLLSDRTPIEFPDAQKPSTEVEIIACALPVQASTVPPSALAPIAPGV